MSWLYRGLSYCRQMTTRISAHVQPHTIASQSPCVQNSAVVCQTQTVRCCSSESGVAPAYKFKVKSPYRNPGPRRFGYQQKFFDGGPLPRGLQEPVTVLKKYRPVDNWSKKKALFGRNDYIDILGDGDIKPVDLLKTPSWLKGFNGNELQRIVRRMNFEGHKIKQLYPTFYHQQQKRIRFLYKKYNQKRGTKHT